MNDKEIVELYWRRSERAIAETASKYGQYCRTVAYNILGNDQDSEECVNDTWLAAWNSMPDKRPGRLNPYLARITRNFALKKVMNRSAKKRGGGEAEIALEELAGCVLPGYGIEQELEERELSEAINGFVNRLADEEQFVFISRYWFMASESEIAKKRGCSRSRINAMLKRTREKLKNYLLQEGLCTIRNG